MTRVQQQGDRSIPSLVRTELTDSQNAVRFAWSDGCIAEFDPVWLRHQAPDGRLVTGQSTIDPAELSAELRFMQASIGEQGQALLTWSDGYGPIEIDSAWLRQHAEPSEPCSPIRHWHEPIDDRIPKADYKAWYDDDSVLRDWLEGYQRDGIALMHGVPTRPYSLEAVAQRFGIVQETNYGRVFSVKSRVDPENLADSSMGLGLHTDNPYREPPPGAQLLHCMVADNEGGESLFADGFSAAERLARQDPDAYAVVAHTPVRFRYETADTLLQATSPMIELDTAGTVEAIRFNSRSMTPAAQPVQDIADFYAAYRALHMQLHAPASVLRIKLKPGDLVLMNNRRLLHGRRAFTRGGDRYLRGCYVHGDSISSRLAVLNRDMGIHPQSSEGSSHDQ